MTYEKTFPLALELRHYRYFHVLAQELHFARAAEKLNISQPALSQQVKWIEAEIGAPLLQRGGRKVGLTKVGLALQEQASSILEQNERAHRHLLAVASGNVGSVDIGFVASAALSGILPRIVYDYRRAYPSTEVRVHEMDMLTQVAAVESGRLDVGFVRPTLPTSRIGDAGRRPGRADVRGAAQGSRAGRGRQDIRARPP